MPDHFCLTIRFLQPYTHGRGEDGAPEWPPSPLRAFQALVAAAAARWNQRTHLEYAAPALEWLERLPPPRIVAPAGTPSGVKCQFYVPDNTADLVVPAWARGDVNKAVKRTEKIVRTTHLRGGDAVHYLFPLPDGVCPHLDVLTAAARGITHLGWGVDMAAGNAAVLTDEEAAELPGERWRPADGAAASGLRGPRAGTLANLAEKHTAFLNRLDGEGFKPVPPLSAFRVVGYRRATDPAGRAWAAFAVLKPDASGNRSFDTPRRCRDVAAWVRHATAEVCRDWPDLAGFVHGHDPAGNQLTGAGADERFMYLPLPTITPPPLNRVESIRRVLIAGPPGSEERVAWVRRRLPGQELVWGDEAMGLLNLLPTSDWVLGRYVGPKEGARAWSTVTPVVWPGHDDGNPRKAGRLLRKAFVDAGLSPATVEGITGDDLVWGPFGFRPGVEPASRYSLPDRLNGRRYHVRVRFAHPVRGPLAVGAGRYRGFGLFAAEDGP